MPQHPLPSLDDPELYLRLDPTGLGDRIAGLPNQCRRAWREAIQFPLPASYSDAGCIVVAGMGGSAIGGQLLKDLAAVEGSSAVEVCRDYRLPPHAGRECLVIASSHSGNTEETLAVYREALHRQARTVAITTGGQLGQMAREAGAPIFVVAHVGEPRTAVGYSFLAPLAILQNLNLIAPKDTDVAEAVEVISTLAHRLGPEVPTNENPAKELAQALHGKMTVIYSEATLSGAAWRWKTQINENSKSWAFTEVVPDAGHNAIVGSRWPKPVGRHTCVVFLRTPAAPQRTKLRFQVFGELLGKAGVNCLTVDGIGRGALSQILSAVMFGDYTSYYLAMLNGEDPSPATPIDYLKSRLGALN